MLDLRPFGRRAFAAAATSALLNYISVFSIVFLVPFYLIQGRRWSAAHAGFVLTAQPLVMAATALLSRPLSDRVGPRVPATAGMLALAAGLLLLSGLHGASPLHVVAAGAALLGALACAVR